MIDFIPLELAVLQAIFDETPELAGKLQEQLANAVVLERENTGYGFLTTMAVPEASEGLQGPQTLGGETYAHVDGLIYGLGFALLLKDGRLHLLDSHSRGGEDTNKLLFSEVKFQIEKAPFRDC